MPVLSRRRTQPKNIGQNKQCRQLFQKGEKTWCCVVNFLLLSLRYAVLRDPAGWLSVNPVRGTVNTSASLDRESPYVQDNKYTAVFIATDNGEFQIPHCMKTLS